MILIKQNYKPSIIWNIPKEQLSEIVKKSLSIMDIQAALGFKTSSGTVYNMIRKRLANDNIDTSHFIGRQKMQLYKIPISDILIENSTYTNRHSLKLRLIKEGILEYKCYICGNTGSWNNAPLSLQLDHKNGIPNDNRIENIRFLCPNCHSQTDTYSGKYNRKRT